MEGIRSQSVAVIGASLPVEPIDIDDFEEIVGSLAPVVKAPDMVVQAQGSQFTLLFLPNRASVQVDVPFPGDADVKLLEAMRFYLKEYAGPRSIAGLGHNFQGELDCGTTTGRSVLDSLLRVDKLGSITMAEPRLGSVTTYFNRGSETRGQLVLSVKDEEANSIDWAFNFHYDLRQPDSMNTFEALDKFEASRVLADESVGAMQTWKEET